MREMQTNGDLIAERIAFGQDESSAEVLKDTNKGDKEQTETVVGKLSQLSKPRNVVHRWNFGGRK